MERKGIRTITRIYLLQQSLFATGNPAPTWIEADRRLLELSVAPSLSPSCRAIIIITTIKSVESSSAPQHYPRLMGPPPTMYFDHAHRNSGWRSHETSALNWRSTVLNFISFPSFQRDVASREGLRAYFSCYLVKHLIGGFKVRTHNFPRWRALHRHLALRHEQSMMLWKMTLRDDIDRFRYWRGDLQTESTIIPKLQGTNRSCTCISFGLPNKWDTNAFHHEGCLKYGVQVWNRRILWCSRPSFLPPSNCAWTRCGCSANWNSAESATWQTAQDLCLFLSAFLRRVLFSNWVRYVSREATNHTSMTDC